MASASTSKPLAVDAHHNNNASFSYFQKTVCLQDWWLTKPEKDFEGKRLAVAGFTSREQQAVRVFTSAAIAKRYDVFTLETIDGICVIIKGFINKARTEENGFPSEVFNHFVFGFPPYWEEYAKRCFGGGCSTEVVSRFHMGLDKLPMHSRSTVVSNRDSGKGSPKNFEKAMSGERHEERDKMNLGVEDCEDMVLQNRQHNISPNGCNESSVEVSNAFSSQAASYNIIGHASNDFDMQSHVIDLLSCVEDELRVNIDSGISNVDVEGTVERYSSTSKDEGHPSPAAGPVKSYVDGMHNDVRWNCSLSMKSTMNTVNSFEVSTAVPLEASSHRVTRSGKMLGILQNERKGNKQAQGNLQNKDPENFKTSHGTSTLNNASAASPLPKTSNVDNANPSNTEMVGFVETSCMNARSSDKPESLKGTVKDVNGTLRSGSTNFFTVSLIQKPEVVIRCWNENAPAIDKTSLSNVSPQRMEKESFCRDPVVQNPEILEPCGNYLDESIEQQIQPPRLEGKIVSPSIMDGDSNVTPNYKNSRGNCKLKNFRSHQKENTMSNCHMKFKSRKCNSASQAFGNPAEENLNKTSSMPTVLGEEMGISDKIASCSEGRLSRCQLNKLKRKQKDVQTTASMLENEKSELNSVSMGVSDQVRNTVANVDNSIGGISVLNLSDAGLQEPMYEFTIRDPDAECVRDGSEQNFGYSHGANPIKDQNCVDGMIRSGVRKSTNGIRSPSRLGVAEDKGILKIAGLEKERILKEASTSRKKAKRKLIYESPVTQKGKEKASIISPESLSFRRSRSGRLLLPTLEFWRNETAIYDADRRITGIKGLHAVQPSRGSRSEPQRKRGQFK